ncbi:GntR family transcriptional regulator [Micromonospora sp. NPDC049366]|uniref:GntR family transcriptional regulator n=1 Tax=Micromonospora sp. NPDC049366 TaxID=3364271 RepID=UPI00379D3A5D
MSERDWRPRYVQLAEELREKIQRGELPAGEPLPSEPELAEQTGISRTSVRNAIRQLREWGLVRAEQGRGTFVRRPKVRVKRSNVERYQWEKDRVHEPEEVRRQTGGTEHDTGLSVHDLKFHAKYQEMDAPSDLAHIFGVRSGTKLLQRTYWTSAKTEDAPLSMSRSYLVHEVVAKNPDLLSDRNEPWPGGTHHQLSTVGIEIDHITDHVVARPPSPDEADILRTESGDWVLVLRKISTSTEGKVVEVADAVYPADRTELVYNIGLKRWNQA